MRQKHCLRGMDLHDVYQQTSVELIAARLAKRRTLAMASREQWIEIAKWVEEARLECDRTRYMYIEHVSTCRDCDWIHLVDSYLDALTAQHTDEVAISRLSA